jgi:hypothetical protein
MRRRFIQGRLDEPDTLLHDHRVPWQVEINQDVGDLKIDAFGARLGRDDGADLGRIGAETCDGVLISLAWRAVDDADFQF